MVDTSKPSEKFPQPTRSPETFAQHVDLPRLGRVLRLGLASRGNTSLDAEDVLAAMEQGVNYLNWCGNVNGMSQAIRQLGPRRKDVKVAIQLTARTAEAAKRELEETLSELCTDTIDVASYYYVEHPHQWQQIIASGGAAEILEAAREDGQVRAIGLTSHQRALAAKVTESGRLDCLMIRYNAAHRGAERDVFPTTTQLGIPVVVFTCLRWGHLLETTPLDPPGFEPPSALDWYRFALMHPAVSVALMAPNGSEELEQNLKLLTHWRPTTSDEYASLAEHGDRVRQHVIHFP